jgi:hypothetical protein
MTTTTNINLELLELDHIADEDLNYVVGGDTVSAVGSVVAKGLESAAAMAGKTINSVVKAF